MKERHESVTKWLVSIPKAFCLLYYGRYTESTYRDYIVKMLKTLKSRQLERAASSQATCTFKYATLRTGETDDTVTLKKQDDG